MDRSFFARLDESTSGWHPPQPPPALSEASTQQLLRGKNLTDPQRQLVEIIASGDYSRIPAHLEANFTPDMVSFALLLSSVTPGSIQQEIESTLARQLHALVFQLSVYRADEEGPGFSDALVTWASSAVGPRWVVKERRYFPAAAERAASEAAPPVWYRKMTTLPAFVTGAPIEKASGRSTQIGSFRFSFTREGSLDFLFVAQDNRYTQGTNESIAGAVHLAVLPPASFVRGVKAIASGLGEVFRSIGQGIGRGLRTLGRAAMRAKNSASQGLRIGNAARRFRDAVDQVRQGPREAFTRLETDLLFILEQEGLTLEDLWPTPQEEAELSEGAHKALRFLRQGYYLTQNSRR